MCDGCLAKSRDTLRACCAAKDNRIAPMAPKRALLVVSELVTHASSALLQRHRRCDELAALHVFVLFTCGFRSAVFRWAPMQLVVHHKPLGELCITHTIARCTLQLAGYGVAPVLGWHTGTFLLLCGECYLAVTAVAAAAAACAHSGEDAFRSFSCFSWVRMLAMLRV